MILLTGASGFIGSHLLKRLRAESMDVRCLVRPSSVSSIRATGVEIIPGDIRDPQAVRKAMGGVHTVVHLAALLRRHSDKEIAETNVKATEFLVDEAKKQNIRHFIFLSSENAMREDLEDAYAATKRQAEAVVNNGFIHSLIFRPCFVYGPGDDHGLARLLARASAGPLVILFGGLKNHIQPVYIGDMVEYLVRGIRQKTEGTYVIAGPEKILLNDFIKKACRARNQKKLYLTVPYSAFYLSAKLAALSPALGWGPSQLKNIYHSRTYSVEPAVKAFGWTPVGVDEGLRRWFEKKS